MGTRRLQLKGGKSDVSMEIDTAAERDEVEGRSEGGDKGKLDSWRVSQLSQFLRQQQEVVYK